MADKFEVMKLWIPLDLGHSTSKTEKTQEWDIYYAYNFPKDGESTTKAWEKASELSTEGWELVSSVPVTASFYPVMEERDRISFPRDIVHIYTAGYVLLFKRCVSSDQ